MFIQPRVVISRCQPRAVVNMNWGCEEPEGQITLFVKRMGDEEEFAFYPALEVTGGRIVFQFDELLFARKPGRFEGRLLLAGNEQARVQLEYVDDRGLINAENF